MIFPSIFQHPHKCYLYNVLTASICFYISFLLCKKNCVAEIVVIVSSHTIELIEEQVIVNNLMNPSCVTHSDSELYLGTSFLDKNFPSHLCELRSMVCIFTLCEAMQWGSANSLFLWLTQKCGKVYLSYEDDLFFVAILEGSLNHLLSLRFGVSTIGGCCHYELLTRFIYSLLFCQLWFCDVIIYIQGLQFNFLNKIKFNTKSKKKQNFCC